MICVWYSFQKVVYHDALQYHSLVPNAFVKYIHPSVSHCESLYSLPETQPPGRSCCCLTTETVEGTALSLEGVDDVERGDGLALGVLGVGDGVTDDTLEEGLQDTTGLLVDHCSSC